jgi:hypothetical protein
VRPGAGLLLGGAGEVDAVRTAVAADLSADAAPGAPQSAGDLGGGDSFFETFRYAPAFGDGKVSVVHPRSFRFFVGKQKIPTRTEDALFFSTRVRLQI